MSIRKTPAGRQQRVLVIGAGVSGLATAIRLRHAGFDVEILEKNDEPGGRMGVIREGGYQFDLGPTIVMMPEEYRVIFRLAGVDPDDYIPMERLDPVYTVHFRDGTVHRASTELTSLIATLESSGFEAAEGYLAYMADVYKRYLVAKDHFITRSFRKPTDFWNPKTLAAGVKLRTFDSAWHSVSKYVKDEKLRELLSFQTLYIGVSPYNGPSIYTIIPMIELVYGVWFIKGGMFAMARGMERLFLEMGGTIRYQTAAERIVIENGRAVGVGTAKGMLPADQVVCSADFPYALESLLPDGFKQQKYRKGKTEQLDYACSCYMMYLGVNRRDFPGLSVHNLAFSGDFEGNIRDIFEGRFPADPSLYVYAPALLDPSLAPEGSLGLYVLVPVPNRKDGRVDWTDERTRAEIREKVYAQIEQITPLKGFRSAVEAERVYTPVDFEQDFNARFGATFGLRPTLLQSNHFRPQAKARACEGLYFAGSSAHPGAGVPIVLMSAKIAAQELMRDVDGQ